MKTQKLSLIFLSCIVLLGGVYLWNSKENTKNTNIQIQSTESGNTTSTSSTLSGVSSPVDPSNPLNVERPTNTGQTATGKIIYYKPNLEWKTRQIFLKDGRLVTYIFGQGNPPETDISLEELKKQCDVYYEGTASGLKQLQIYFDQGDCTINRASASVPIYVSPEVEKHLYAALSSPEWEKLAHECQRSFDETDRTFNADQDMNSRTLFSSGYLDIETFIRVDESTGRKVLDATKVRRIIDVLGFATLQGGPHNTVPPDNPGGDCVDRHARDIIWNLAEALEYNGQSY